MTRSVAPRVGSPNQPYSTGAARPAVVAEVQDVHKTYGQGEAAVAALDGVSYAFPSGQLTAIMGPSGSGKSTLLHCLSGLDTVTSGRVLLAERDLSGMSDTELTVLRRREIGFVFQSFNLLPTLTAEENITLPLDLAKAEVGREWLNTLIETVGLSNRRQHRPAELSGGQQQRVAIARALVTMPSVVFADEPTGNLDSRSSAEVLGLLRRAVDDLQQSVIMVTHDPTAAGYADSVVYLADGQIADTMQSPTAESVLDRMKSLGGV
jgi:putative ABC transport system ATP-binding protein